MHIFAHVIILLIAGGDEAEQVLGIRDEKTRMKVTPPLAMAPITQDDDMCDGNRMMMDFVMALFPTLKGAARPITTASAPPQHPTRESRIKIRFK